jgi:hypothetical protein
MDTLNAWESIARLMIQSHSPCYKSDKSDKSDKRLPSIPSPPPPIKPKRKWCRVYLPPEKEKPMLLAKDWKSTSLAEFYMRKVYEQRESPPPPKPNPAKPHKFPLTIIRHRGRETDRTNFTHLQELWNGREKPLEILTAGHRERNLTTQIK